MSKLKLEDLKYVGIETDSIQKSTTIDDSEVLVEDSADCQNAGENSKESEEILDQSEEIASKPEEIASKPEETVDEPEEMKVQSTIVGSTVNVKKLAIYPIPSTTVPSRSFTGNVEILGRIEEFTIVKYVKSGFGSVKGYTLGL